MDLVDMFHHEKRWVQRAIILHTFHKINCMKNRNWTMSDTAKRMNISIGHVSENIALALSLNEDTELENLSRNKALERIRKNHDR